MRFWSLAIPCLLAVATPCAAAARHDATKSAGPRRTTVIEDSRRADINRANLFVSNIGAIGYDLGGSYAGGLLFPNHTVNPLVFAGGLWIGARISGTPRVTVAEYDQEFRPGRILGGIPE